jgi:putative phosphoesterase
MIGIMADSHDNLHAVKKAAQFFNDAGCELVIHAGDFVAPFAARELENLDCPVKAVFGNCDGEKKGLEKAVASFGEVKEAPFPFTHNNRQFIVTHVLASIDAHIASRKYDVIIYAHTHKPEVRKEGKILIVNPGETGGWVSGKGTVALLDTETLSAEIIPL